MPKPSNLELYHSTWAMERRHPVEQEWSLEQQCEMVAAAGFHGLNIDPDTDFIPSRADTRNALINSGLSCSMCGFPSCLDDVRFCLDWCTDLDATALVVNARFFPLNPGEAMEFVQSSMELGRSAGIPVQFETHRFTLTNDLLFTCELVELCPDMELVADLSHYVVGREMPMPVDDFHQDMVARILGRSVSIQGRVASREQVQVPLHFPRHQPWVEQFKHWWRQGIRSWLDRDNRGESFNFTCELGPPDYAITDAEGYEMADRWQESLELKNVIENIWAEENAS